jgi:uncharacterized protein (UPF0548 family)
MISLHRPSTAEIDSYLARVRRQPFSYPEVGASRDNAPPAGYVIDHRLIQVGVGESAFQAARECLRRWDVFQLGWISVCWPHIAPEPGAAVATLVRLGPTWWLNPCRVIYVEDEPRRLRFAYGTTIDHFATGEERFTVEWREDDTVWYDLYAFSRPRSLLARCGYPVMRAFQKRGGDQSMPAFARAVRKRLASQRRAA